MYGKLIVGGGIGAGFAQFAKLGALPTARVAIASGIAGRFSNLVGSILVAQFMVEREKESLPPAVAQKAEIDVSPASLLYGDVEVRSTACRMLVVSNKGTAELEVTATTLGGANASLFDIVSGKIISGTPSKVLPGKTHFVEVRFTPDSEDGKNASLEIASNDRTVNVPLSGTGKKTVTEETE